MSCRRSRNAARGACLRTLRVLSRCGAAALALGGSLAHADNAAPLPLSRVRFYETGVGYFERSGTMPAGDLTLPVPAAHLDDALKTLVVLSPGGSVGGLEFASSVSRDMARSLAGLGGDGSNDAHIGYASLLKSLKGATVELGTAQGKLEGRLIEVLSADEGEAEACDVARAPATAVAPASDASAPRCQAQRHASVLLFGKDSEIRRVRVSDIASVRPTDAGFKTRLGSALDALGEGGAKTARAVALHAEAGKPIALGYVAEAPVWRSTYRLVLDGSAPRAVLQGWALIHNDTDEDWKQVKVEIVNGEPDSFLFPLAAPRYARRTLVTPERELSTVPQLLDTTVDNMWSGGAGGLGLTGIGEGGGGTGEGIGFGSIGTIGHGSGAGSIRGVAESSALQVGNLAATGQADGREAAAMFLYALPSTVDLHAHSSALLPFLSRTVGARRIAFFTGAGTPAQSAVHVKNETAQTLPAGTIAIFSDGGFAGEAGLSRTKPHEERIVRYGVDLDVELENHGSSAEDVPQLFAFEGENLVLHFIRRHTESYVVHNRSSADRTVYLTLSYGHNTDVQGADRIEFDPESRQPLAVFEVGAQGDSPRELEVREGLRKPIALVELGQKELRAYAAAPTLPNEQQAALRKAADLMDQAAAARKEREAVEGVLGETEEEVQHLRASIQAIADGNEELTERLVAAEDHLSELHRRQRELRDRHTNLLEASRAALTGLTAAGPKSQH